MNLQKLFKAASYVVMGSAVLLSVGCSDKESETPQAEVAQVEQQAVKSAETLKPEVDKAEAAPVAEVVKTEANKVEAAVDTAKAEVAAVVAPSGEKAYATCAGCHGAMAEGGVGPRLNNQAAADIVAKLEKYKAGEQMGAMTGMMAPMAAPLSTDDMKSIADYVITLK